MSTLRATNLKGGSAGSAPNLPDGAVVTGVVTATSFSGSGANLTGIDATALKDGNGTVRVQANTTGAVVTGIATATTFSGNITGVAATFSGAVSVGGTLTYEDVTNVDSVGMVTARNGVKVLAGGINAVGVVTATSFEGSGANLTGIDALPSLTGTAYGSIASNRAVLVRSDAKLEAVVSQAMGWGTEFLPMGNTAGHTHDMCMIGPQSDAAPKNTFALIYLKQAGYHACCRLGVVDNSNLTVTFGAETVLDTGTCDYPQVVYNANKGHIVYSWQVSTSIRAKVCYAFSGTTQTSFGSEQMVEQSAIYFNRCAYEPAQATVVWNFNDSSSGNGFLYGRTAQGSNSGTYLTMGSKTRLCDNGSTYNRLGVMIPMWTVASDTNRQNQMAMVFSNNQSGTDGIWWQGLTVSGNSVSRGGNHYRIEVGGNCNFGYANIYSTSQSQYYQVGIAVFTNGSTATIVTLSMSNVNATSQALNDFETTGSSAGLSDQVEIPYDPKTNSFLVTYEYTPSGGTAQLVSRNVTFSDPGASGGWNPTIGSRVVIGDSTDAEYITAINTTKPFETASDDKRYVAIFRDLSNSNYLTGSVMRPATSTNLTADSFVGFTDAAYTDGQTAKVKVVGNQLTQAGLTTGAKHYVQNDGTVGTTATNPSVVAGTALNGNTLLIKP
jgi:hypothetical protein